MNTLFFCGDVFSCDPADEILVIAAAGMFSAVLIYSGITHGGCGFGERRMVCGLKKPGMWRFSRRGVCRAGCLIGLLLVFPAVAQRYDEVVITAADYKNLDTFETAALAKADKVFAAKDYRAATAEYDLFLVENGRSSAAAYALLRKGRSQMLDNKRYEAVRTFKEVIDYFPDAVLYAAAALYYQGQCHFENGEQANAVKVWQKMVADAEYAKHALAAPALLALANELARQQKTAEAASYYEQAAVEFRTKNPDVARQAIGKACEIHIRLLPSEKKMKDFYLRARTTRHHPDNAPDENKYWADVRAMIHRFAAGFAAEEKSRRAAYFKYWADAMEGKRLTDNAFRIDWAYFRLQHEDDADAWVGRLDKQFADTFKPGDYAQVVQFIQAFGKQKEKVGQYYAKLDFAKMENALIDRLVRALVESNEEMAMARNACDKINHERWNDDDRNRFIDWVQYRDREMVEMVCRRMKDPDYGKYRLLRYYHWQRIADKGLPLADEVATVPKYAGEAYYMKGELLEHSQRWADAIQAYKASNREPDSLFRIAECMRRLKQTTQAIAQLREIENFFEPQAPEAALRIAWIYRDGKEEKQFIAALRGILKKYPRSGQSSTAHLELERLGVKMGGGVDAD